MMAGKKEDLPADVLTVIYHCHNCGGKDTYGRDYFTQVGTPSNCQSCGTPYIQEDRIPRLESDTSDDLDAKKATLMARRGVVVDAKPKPIDPQEIKRQRVNELRAELDQLEKGDEDHGKEIRLGP